ncbi:MAG: thioredoxin family protein [Chloroflexi bacterium]|nr:thioredoxin family protein [Chloroflexota bacterium]
MLTVKILGPGCANCERLEAEARAALQAITPPLDFAVEKVTEMQDIMAYGVMSTPGLVINEQLVSEGRVPRREQIVTWALQILEVQGH